MTCKKSEKQKIVYENKKTPIVEEIDPAWFPKHIQVFYKGALL